MSDIRRTRVRYRGRTYVVCRAPTGAVTIEYSAKDEMRRINPYSGIADELRSIKPEAFAPPIEKPTRRQIASTLKSMREAEEELSVNPPKKARR